MKQKRGIMNLTKPLLSELPGEKRIQWRPPSGSRARQAVRPAHRARQSVASLNEMMGRDPRAADSVS